MNSENGVAPLAGPAVVSTISISWLLTRLLKRTYSGFTGVLEQAAACKDENQKKVILLEWIKKVRQQWIKMLVLLTWSRKKKTDTGFSLSSGDLASFQSHLHIHNNLLTSAADALFFASQATKQCRIPVFDVSTAVDVFTAGEYLRLPSSIRDCITTNNPAQPLNTNLQEVYGRLHDLIQFRLFSGEKPSSYTHIQIANGRAYCEVADEFSIELTLIREDTIAWRVLSLQIFVQPAASPTSIVTESFSQQLVNFVQHHIFSSTEPLKKIYEIVHHFCLSLAFNVLLEQAKGFLIKKEQSFFIQHTIDSLTIFYWTKNRPKPAESSDFIRIARINEGETPLLVVTHHPLKGEALAKKTINLSSLSVEQILLEILSHQATRLLNDVFSGLQQAINILPLEQEDIQIVSTTLNKIYNSHIRILLFANESLSLSVDNYTGKFTVTLTNNTREIAEKVEDTINKKLDSIKIIIDELKRRSITAHIEEYMKFLDLTPFRKLRLQYASDATLKFRFSEKVSYFRVPGWLPQGNDSQLSGYIVIELTKKFRLNLYFLCTRFDVHSNILHVDQINVIAQDLWASDLQVSASDSLSNASVTPIDPVLTTLHFCVRSGTLHSILDAVVKRCCKLVAQLSYVKANQKFSPQFVNESVEFVINSRSPIRKVVLSYSEIRHQWQAAVTFAENQLNHAPAQVDEHDRVVYLTDLSIVNIFFKNSSHPHFMLPWSEIARVNSVSALATQWQQICKSNEPDCKQLQSQFKLIKHKYSHISFALTLPTMAQQIVTIGYDRAYTITGTNPHPFKKFLDSKLDMERNIKSTLQLVGRSTFPLHLIREQWHPSATILAQDFCIIPLYVCTLRVIYRGLFGIDFRFVFDDFVRINDSSRTLFNRNTDTSTIQPLYGLSTIVKQFETHVPPTGKADPNDLLICHHCLPEFLPRLHKLMGCHYLINMITKFLQEHRESLTNDPQIVRKDNLVSVSFHLQSLSSCMFDIQIKDFQSLELSTRSNPNNSSAQKPDPYVLNIFFSQIAAVPFSFSEVQTFLNILCLPIQALNSFVILMRSHISPWTPGTTSVMMLLDSKREFFYDRQRQCILFCVRCSTNKYTIDFPLEYFYTQNIIRYWVMDKTIRITERGQITAPTGNVFDVLIQWMKNTNEEDLLRSAENYLLQTTDDTMIL